MATLSEFGWEKRFDKEQHVSRLLHCLTGLQPQDGDYPSAMEYALYKMQHHKFTDPDPAEVNDHLEGMENRLAANAQLLKAQWLRDLRTGLMQLGLGERSSQLDFEHRVLCLLYYLARDPLHATYRPPRPKEARRGGAATPDNGSPPDDSEAGGSGGSSESEWDDGRSTASREEEDGGSALSDWSCSGDEDDDLLAQGAGGAKGGNGGIQGAQHRAARLAAHAVPTLQDLAIRQLERCELQLPSTTLGEDFATLQAPPTPPLPPPPQAQQPAAAAVPPPRPQPKAQQHRRRQEQVEAGRGDEHASSPFAYSTDSSSSLLPDPPCPGVYPEGSLFCSVVLHQHRARGYEPPPPDKCVSEEDLVRQVLNMLRGMEFPGRCFELHRLDNRFSLAEDCHVATLSPAALDSLLQPLLNCGSMALRLRIFLDLVQAGVAKGSAHIIDFISLTPTLTAFASCLGTQLAGVLRSISALEAQRLGGGGEGTGALLPPLSLMEVQLLLDKDLQRLRLLYNVMDAALPPSGRVSAAENASHTLTVLHSMLNDVAGGGSPYGPDHGAALLQLFLCSLRPLLQKLHLWLYQGLLDDPAGECFITADRRAAVDSSAFWSSGYTERSTQGGDVAAPRFLLHLVPRLLATGKSLVLLQHTGGGGLKQLQQRAWQSRPGTAAQGSTRPGTSTRQHARGSGGGVVEADLWAHTVQLVRARLTDEEVAASPPGGHGGYRCTQPSFVQPRLRHDLLVEGRPEEFAVRMRATRRMGCQAELMTAEEEQAAGMDDCARDTLQQDMDKAYEEEQQRQDSCDVGDGLSETGSQQSSRSGVLCEPMSQHRAAASPGAGGSPAASRTPSHEQEGEACTSLPQQQDPQTVLADWAPRLQQALCGGHALQQQQQQQGYQEGLLLLGLPGPDALRPCPFAAVAAQSPYQGGRPPCDLIAGYNNLPTYEGSVSASLWGSAEPGPTGQHRHQCQLQEDGVAPDVEQQLDWLMSLQAVSFPAEDGFFRQCLERPILRQVDSVGRRLMVKLVGEWGLMRELRLLRNLFLLSVPVLHGFSTELFERLSKGEKLHTIPQHELDHMLQRSLPADEQGARSQEVPSAHSLAVRVEERPPEEGTGKLHTYGGMCSVGDLRALQFDYTVSWPLSMVVDYDVLQQYNHVTIFLLQVLWAKHSLEQLRRRLWHETGATRAEPLTVEMTHFVVTLHSFVSDRIMHGAWAQLEKDLEQARSMDEVTSAHSTFLARIQRQCFLQEDKTWRLLQHAVHAILNMVLAYTQLQTAKIDPVQSKRKHAMKVVEEALAKLVKEFRDKHRYLLKLLTARTLKISGHSELHHLVMRLNYNNFYPEGDKVLDLTVA